jgi:hypothetical protein
VEPFDTTCILWCPGIPNVTAGGRLRFDRARGVTIDVAGPLDLDLPMLHGHADGQPITLFDLIVTSSAWHMGSGVVSENSRRSSAMAATLLRGTHADYDTTSSLSMMQVSLDSLDDWYATGCPPIPLLGRSEWSDDQMLTMRWEAPPSLEAALPSGVSVRLHGDRSVRGNEHEYHATERVTMSFIYAKPVNLARVSNDIERVRWLAALVTGEPARVTAMSVTPEGASTSCDLFRQPIDPPGEHRHTSVHEMSLPLPDFDFASMFPRWMEMTERFGVPMALCFANWHSTGLFAENRLLNVASAAEALGDLLYPNDRTELSERPEAAKSFVEAFPPAERDLLRTRLKHINEPSLRQRLRQLVVDAGRPFEYIAGDAKQWVADVVEARNAIVHPSDFQGGLAMAALATMVEYLIEVHLLRELGVEQARLDERLPRTRRARSVEHLVGQWRTELRLAQSAECSIATTYDRQHSR